MVTRKKVKKQAKPHYVRKAKSKGKDSSIWMRRSFSLLAFVLLLGGIGFGIKTSFDWIRAQLFSQNSHFEIQHLVVESDGNLREDQIREYAKVSEGMNLFAVTFKELEDRFKDVSVVESVYLQRKLPHTLIIKVKQRVPMARIMGLISRSYPLVVDREGVVLPPRRSATSLPLIKGLNSKLILGKRVKHPDVATALKIIARWGSTGYLRTYVRIESLDVQYSDYIDMRMSGEIRVKMPRYSIKSQLQKLSTVIKIETGKGKRVKTVDLTVDSEKVPIVSYY